MNRPTTAIDFGAFKQQLTDSARSGMALLEAGRRALARPEGVVLFGAGGFARKVIAHLRANHVRICAVVDTSPAKRNTQLDGIDVIAPLDVTEQHRACTAVISVCGHAVGFSALAAVARASGFATPLPGTLIFWLFPHDTLPYFGWSAATEQVNHSESLYEVYRQLEDPTSQTEYLAEASMRLSMNFESANVPDVPGQYFPPFVKNLEDREVYVDGGAYDGDTMRAFVQRSPKGFSRWFAVEPDAANGAKLVNSLSQYPQLAERVKLLPYGLSDTARRVRFSANGVMTSAISEVGNTEIELRALDTLIDEPITFLKLDIEGSERQALDGARRTIERSPDAVLAIAGYHEPDDLWRIPQQLKTLRPSARLAARSHGYFGFDFVFYSVPDSRWVGSA